MAARSRAPRGRRVRRGVRPPGVGARTFGDGGDEGRAAGVEGGPALARSTARAQASSGVPASTVTVRAGNVQRPSSPCANLGEGFAWSASSAEAGLHSTKRKPVRSS